MDIETFLIDLTIGRSNDWLQLGINKEQHDFLNEIGNKGSRAMKCTFEQYMNKIHKDKYVYKIVKCGESNSLFTDRFMAIRVNKS